MSASVQQSSRELVPFRVRTTDGREVELEYSSPRPADGVEVIDVDFSESHESRSRGCNAQRSSWCTTSPTSAARTRGLGSARAG
jgi:hypothetical protein